MIKRPNTISNTLHYGGSISATSPTGLSSQPQAGDTFKKLKRLEMIIRMEAAGIPERALAAMLTISVPRLRYIKKGPDYLKTRMRLVHGIVLDTDSHLAVIREQRKEMLAQLLPSALQVIANVIISQPATYAEKKLQIATAQDFMDREGTFAKVSRTEVKPVSFFDFEASDAEARSVMDAIRVAAQAPRTVLAARGGAEVASESSAPSSLEETNRIFSQSATISEVDQEQAIAELEASEGSFDSSELPTDEEIEETGKMLLIHTKPETEKIQ